MLTHSFVTGTEYYQREECVREMGSDSEQK